MQITSRKKPELTVGLALEERTIFGCTEANWVTEDVLSDQVLIWSSLVKGDLLRLGGRRLHLNSEEWVGCE